MANTWSQRISTADAYRRASGRRHYNAERQLNANLRRIELVPLLGKGLTLEQMAIRLHTSTSTVFRDIKKILEPQQWSCPTCHTLHWRSEFRGIRRPIERSPRNPKTLENGPPLSGRSLMRLFNPASFS